MTKPTYGQPGADRFNVCGHGSGGRQQLLRQRCLIPSRITFRFPPAPQVLSLPPRSWAMPLACCFLVPLGDMFERGTLIVSHDVAGGWRNADHRQRSVA